MHCPFCTNTDTQVKDSRPADEGSSIRRRRECPECGARFTTFERVQLREMLVAKAGGRIQPFDRNKMIRSMTVALRKRPVTAEQIEKAANDIVRQLESRGDAEVRSTEIGDLVMQTLARVDMIGYIRYASVYKEFTDPEDFKNLLDDLRLHLDEEAREAAE